MFLDTGEGFSHVAQTGSRNLFLMGFPESHNIKQDGNYSIPRQHVSVQQEERFRPAALFL